MKSPHKINKGGVKIECDRLGRLFLRRTVSSANLAESFSIWQGDLLSHGPQAVANEEGLVLCMVTFEGIVTRQALEASLSQIKAAYTLGETVCIEWEIGGWVDRRELSAMSICVLSAFDPNQLQRLNVKHAINKADESLSGLDRLLEAAAAWAAMVLPGVLVGHVTGAQPMAVLPREVLARRESGMALARKNRPLREFSSLPIGTALEGYFCGAGDDRNPTVAEAINSACLNQKSKAKMYDQVCGLVPAATFAGPNTSLFALFVLDLIENGTERKDDLKLNTIGKYAGQIGKRLLPRLIGKTITHLSCEEWSKIYDEIRSECASSMVGEVSAALKAWHEFLEEWFDVTPVEDISIGKIARPPRANFIWPHELRRIFEWLDSSTLDERLIAQLKVAFVIMSEARIRTEELLNIRIKNVHVHNRSGVIEIEVSPSRLDPSLKSSSARRRIYIQIESGRQIEHWLQRRLCKELAVRDEFLFGDPYDQTRLYQVGKFYGLINQLIKDATGDPRASIHSFSHTWISKEVASVLLSQNESGINPMDGVANKAGHLGNHTSIFHYAHVFERALRQCLDRALRRIEISSADASAWCGVAEDTIRKRVSRKRQAEPSLSAQNEYWHLVLKSGHGRLHLPPVECLVELETPLMPAFLQHTDAVDFSRVLHALRDLSDGVSVHSVASRVSCSTEWIEEVASGAAMIMRQLGVKGISLNFLNGVPRVLPEDAIRVLVQTRRLGSRSGFDFRAVSQPKLRPILKYLEGEQSMDTLQRRIFSWKQSWCHGFISVVDPSLTDGLVELFISANVPVSCLALTVERMNASAKEGALAMCDKFMLACGVAPQIIHVEKKGGRPSAYLMFSSNPIDVTSPPGKASASVAQLNTLLLAAATFVELGKFAGTE